MNRGWQVLTAMAAGEAQARKFVDEGTNGTCELQSSERCADAQVWPIAEDQMSSHVRSVGTIREWLVEDLWVEVRCS